MKYFTLPVIDASKPFEGFAQTSATFNPADGNFYADYSGQLYNDNGPNLTMVQYRSIEGHESLKVISLEEMDSLFDSHENSLVTQPKVITSERYYDMLEVLPPCRWHNAGGLEVFHVSERITGNLVSWFARNGSDYWEFDDLATMTDDQIKAKFNKL